MSRENQIEEMADIITDAMLNGAENFVDCVVVAVEELVAKGYRKSTDVAEEIFAEIENALELLLRIVTEGRKNDGIKYQQLHDGRIVSIEAIKYFIAELKKKYIGEDINVTTTTEEGK